MIEHRPLVKLHELRLGISPEEPRAQFEHVVRIAALWACGVPDAFLPLVRSKEKLVGAVAAHGVGMPVHHLAPEVERRIVIIFFPRKFVKALVARELRDLGVGVQPRRFTVRIRQDVQDVAVFKHGNEDVVVTETPGESKVTRIACQGVNVRQRLRHATVLDRQHFLHGSCVQFGDDFRTPLGQIRQHWKRRLESAATIGINQPGENLVHVVPRNAAHIVETASRLEFQLALLEFSPSLLALGHTSAISVPVRPLTFFQTGNQIGNAFEHALVTRDLPHHAAGAEMMTHAGAIIEDGHGQRFPLCRQTGFTPGVSQQSVGIDREDPFKHRITRRFERAVQQLHGRKAEWFNHRARFLG
ncbi:MAG: hypothetical protein WCL11_19255 [Verrucomicrobiota bacterium]